MVAELTEINDIDDSLCHKSVQKLFEILSGDKCGLFTFAIQIPEKFVINNLFQTKKIIKKYCEDHHLSKDEIRELKSITQKSPNKFNTLNDILEAQIIDLLNLGYEFHDNEGCIEFNLKSTVFISEEMSDSLEDSFLSKVITLLECYEGKRSFYVHTSFQNGNCNISIQV